MDYRERLANSLAKEVQEAGNEMTKIFLRHDGAPGEIGILAIKRFYEAVEQLRLLAAEPSQSNAHIK